MISGFKKNTKNSCIIWKDKIYNYEWLLSNISIWDEILKKQGLFNKKIIAVISEYSPRAVALFLALMKDKFIIVPIAPSSSEEIKDKISVSKVEAIIKLDLDDSHDHDIEFTNNRFSHPAVKALINKNKAGLILFSSGSTGKPKAMIHDLDNLNEVYSDRKKRDLKTIVLLRIDHIGGINTLFNILSSCGTAIIPSKKNPEEICELIEKYKAHILPATPTFLNLLLVSNAHKRFDLSSLKLISYGTEPMPQPLLKKLREAFPKAKLLQTFGTSETGIAAVRSKSSKSLYMKIEDKNFEYKIVNSELWVKSKMQILAYLNYDSPFTENGWFPTGDLVEEIEGRYLKIIGRAKEVINVGGQKALPFEIESVLLEIEEIEDAVVYGEPNALLGQIVVADVVLKERKADNDELIKKVKKYCLQKLDSYKVPAKIKIVDDIEYGNRFKKRRMHGSERDCGDNRECP